MQIYKNNINIQRRSAIFSRKTAQLENLWGGGSYVGLVGIREYKEISEVKELKE